MYICLGCKAVFDEPIRGVVDEYPVPFENHYEKRYGQVCPCCENPSVSEAFVCQKCGQALPVQERSRLDSEICDDCAAEEESEPVTRELHPAFEGLFESFFERRRL